MQTKGVKTSAKTLHKSAAKRITRTRKFLFASMTSTIISLVAAVVILTGAAYATYVYVVSGQKVDIADTKKSPNIAKVSEPKIVAPTTSPSPASTSPSPSPTTSPSQVPATAPKATTPKPQIAASPTYVPPVTETIVASTYSVQMSDSVSHLGPTHTTVIVSYASGNASGIGFCLSKVNLGLSCSNSQSLNFVGPSGNSDAGVTINYANVLDQPKLTSATLDFKLNDYQLPASGSAKVYVSTYKALPIVINFSWDIR